MLTAEILAAAASGGLLVAAALTLWGSLRVIPGADRAAVSIRWGAAGLLMLSALLEVHQGHGLQILLFLAGVAAPALRASSSASRWSSPLSIAPGLALAGAELLAAAGLLACHHRWSVVTSVRGVPLLVCGALGIRAFAAHLTNILQPAPMATKLSVVTYWALSLLVGCMTMASLWQRGTVWDQSVEQARLAQTWLLITAAMVLRGKRPRLRNALMLLGTGSLIYTVASIR